MILIRNTCRGDLGKLSRLSSISGALATVIGMILNQIGGKLSDAVGRRFFFNFGPVMQMVTGVVCYARPDSALLLATFKAVKIMATTLSGTVMGGAAMRDLFEGKELASKTAKAGSIIGP